LRLGLVKTFSLLSFVLSYCIICEMLPAMIVSGQPSVPYDLGDWTYISKPVYPIKINASQIPVGANWTYVYSLEKNQTYHVYCYGEWIDYDPFNNKTDYDIFVYNPLQEQVSYHTEAAGLPEHLGTTVDHPYFTPEHTGNYSFLIENDPRESQGAKEATFMLIEHVECDKWHKSHLQGKINSEPVENTSRAYEFSTTSKHVEVWIEVPDTLDMYEARLYPMANPSKEVGVILNDVPLSWEPGLYGNRSGLYGGYNLDSRGFRQTDAMASCEYPGQDMLINYTSFDEGNILYHLVLIGEHGVGDLNFRVKTDFEAPALNILNPPDTAFSNNDTTIIAVAKDNESGLKQVLLNYTRTDWTSWASIQMAPSQNQTFAGTIPEQPAGTTVAYQIVAFDEVENYAEVQSSYLVKNPSNLTCSLSNSTIYFGEDITVSGSISYGGLTVTLNYTFDETMESRPVSADAYGEYTDVHTPSMTGLWTVVATWPGNESCFGASSDPMNFTVLKRLMSVTCNMSAREIIIGETATVTGRIEPVFENMNMMLIFQRPNGSLIKEYVEIQLNGTFITSFQPDSTGSWRVQAQLQGDGLRYVSSNSDLQAFNVNDTWIERYKFYMIGGAIALVAAAIVYIKKYRGT